MAQVLFLTELLPYPLTSGAKIRAYYVLRMLADRHRVTLLSFVRADDRPEDVAHLSGFLERVVTVPMQRSVARNARAVLVSLLTGRPAIIAREEIGAMRRAVEGLLDETPFDVVHADQIPMAYYGLLGDRGVAESTLGPGSRAADRQIRRPVRGIAGSRGSEGGERESGPRRLLDEHNATFQIVERLARNEQNGLKRRLLAREARAFARYEAEVCRQFDAVTFVTEEDRQALLARLPGAEWAERSCVIPICVDTAAQPAVTPLPEPFRVTHVGTMFWPPNVEGMRWFAEEVWPQVREELPGARLTLIGKNPPEWMQAWGQQADVDVPGFVADLTPYLAETAVFVVPLWAGGGMRVKIVDAWCWGLPVVSTAIGAEGITIRPGDNLLIADTPAEFARAVVEVYRDVGLQGLLRANGRRWVEERYDWRRVYTAWDDVYRRLGAAEG